MPSVRLVLLLILHCRGYWNFSQMLMNASAFYRVAWILRELSWTLQDRVPFPLDALQAHGKFCLRGCHSVEFDVEDLPFWYRRSKDSSRLPSYTCHCQLLPLDAFMSACCCVVRWCFFTEQHDTASTALHFLPTFYNNCEDRLHLSLSSCTVVFKCLLNSSWKIAAPGRFRTETSFHVHCL
jgi:hypothetical protein